MKDGGIVLKKRKRKYENNWILDLKYLWQLLLKAQGECLLNIHSWHVQLLTWFHFNYTWHGSHDWQVIHYVKSCNMFPNRTLTAGSWETWASLSCNWEKDKNCFQWSSWAVLFTHLRKCSIHTQNCLLGFAMLQLGTKTGLCLMYAES